MELSLLQDLLPLLPSPILATLWLICASLLGKDLPFLAKGSRPQGEGPRDSPGMGAGRVCALQAWAPLPRVR